MLGKIRGTPPSAYRLDVVTEQLSTARGRGREGFHRAELRRSPARQLLERDPSGVGHSGVGAVFALHVKCVRGLQWTGSTGQTFSGGCPCGPPRSAAGHGDVHAICSIIF